MAAAAAVMEQPQALGKTRALAAAVQAVQAEPMDNWECSSWPEERLHSMCLIHEVAADRY